MTVLVDTGVWIEHFRPRGRAAGLVGLLEGGEVAVHAWILGELALGTLGPKRGEILASLDRLPACDVLSDGEVRTFIELRQLAGSGIGWVDAQLAGAALVSGLLLWTLDRNLGRVASQLGIAYAAP